MKRKISKKVSAIIILVVVFGTIFGYAQESKNQKKENAYIKKAEDTIIKLQEKLKGAIVGITSKPKSGKGGMFGTGFVVGKSGYIISITEAIWKPPAKTFVVFYTGKRYRAKEIARNEDKGLVLIKIDAKDLPVLKFGDSDKVKVGQLAFTLGNSFHSLSYDYQVALSMGVVSGIYKVEHKSYAGTVFETSAAVNPGGDGGPLVNLDGQAIGIVINALSKSKWLGTAVPINIVKEALPDLMKGKNTKKKPKPPKKAKKKAWWGIEVSLEKEFKKGASVLNIVKGSPAANAGLKKGDYIIELNDEKIKGGEDFLETTEEFSAGDTVKLKISRNEKIIELEVKLTEKPKKVPAKQKH